MSHNQDDDDDDAIPLVNRKRLKPNPSETPKEKPSETKATLRESTRKKKPQETPKVTPQETPKATPKITPKATPQTTRSKKETPKETPRKKIKITPQATPMRNSTRSKQHSTPHSTSYSTSHDVAREFHVNQLTFQPQVKAWSATMGTNFKLAKGQQANYDQIIDMSISYVRDRWKNVLLKHLNCFIDDPAMKIYSPAIQKQTQELASEYLLDLEDIVFRMSYYSANQTNSPFVVCRSEHKNIFAYENKITLLIRVLVKYKNIFVLLKLFNDNLYQLAASLEHLDLQDLDTKPTTSIIKPVDVVKTADVTKPIDMTLMTDDQMVEAGRLILKSLNQVSNVRCKHCRQEAFIEFRVTQSRSADEGITTKVFCSAPTCKEKPAWTL